jgi:hypothetical protein
MENLSIEGLTPEQIAELQASIENFKRQNEPTKFYKSVCWAEYFYDDEKLTEFYFLFKSCSIAGQVHLELVSPKLKGGFEMYKEQIINQNPSSIETSLFGPNPDDYGDEACEEWEEEFYEACGHLGCTLDSYHQYEFPNLCFEHVEISEEEYNNSHTWLTPTFEVVTKINW